MDKENLEPVNASANLFNVVKSENEPEGSQKPKDTADDWSLARFGNITNDDS